jgi:hypothetical protein
MQRKRDRSGFGKMGIIGFGFAMSCPVQRKRDRSGFGKMGIIGFGFAMSCPAGRFVTLGIAGLRKYSCSRCLQVAPLGKPAANPRPVASRFRLV